MMATFSSREADPARSIERFMQQQQHSGKNSACQERGRERLALLAGAVQAVQAQEPTLGAGRTPGSSDAQRPLRQVSARPSDELCTAEGRIMAIQKLWAYITGPSGGGRPQ
jgi:hypothetical protein